MKNNLTQNESLNACFLNTRYHQLKDGNIYISDSFYKTFYLCDYINVIIFLFQLNFQKSVFVTLLSFCNVLHAEAPAVILHQIISVKPI